MPVDFRTYTVDEVAKQLALLEIHFRQYNTNDAVFCLECCGKHLLSIQGLADEGVTFFPEAPVRWKELAKWAQEIRDIAKGGIPSETLVVQWADEARMYRKNLQHDFMGNLGHCECVNGFEPCCLDKERS